MIIGTSKGIAKCVNGGYQQEYSLNILDEALTKIPLDGVFFNMIGYRTTDYSHVHHGICQSDACRNRFSDWSDGLDLPTVGDNDDPVCLQYSKFKSETSAELFFRIHDLIKSHGDHIAINTYTHAGTDFFRKESNSHTSLYDGKVTWENGMLCKPEGSATRYLGFIPPTMIGP